ncbi:unnamed protein product [Phytomonas sp. Hart1]|nr:unnamed protein product [Phytomonas sp. Hart1]|eukprot:CCW69270.1 unnamed protein product [Phytomonas sp. isolate Hart1]
MDASARTTASPNERESAEGPNDPRHPPPFAGIPSMASRAYVENLPALGPLPPRPLTVVERFTRVLQLKYGQAPDFPSLGGRMEKAYDGLWDYLCSPMVPLLPRTYVDAHSRPNPCPEEYWWASWRWPRRTYVNAKIPPPIDGKYLDYYHYLSFKNWFERERDVYVAQANLVMDMLNRCIMKEGSYNAAKNCRHLYNKSFAMSRMEELQQAMLYMAITGNAAIRETPYPENFVEEKRKIYDDWLFRTRMKKPGDAA